ncbi:hypothetical protein EDD99_3619 [Streptomyces sp. 846.5]|nr:hypothetical protein EDD99_3619 [Streptomyces sp. 846.5]
MLGIGLEDVPGRLGDLDADPAAESAALAADLDRGAADLSVLRRLADLLCERELRERTDPSERRMQDFLRRMAARPGSGAWTSPASRERRVRLRRRRSAAAAVRATSSSNRSRARIGAPARDVDRGGGAGSSSGRKSPLPGLALAPEPVGDGHDPVRVRGVRRVQRPQHRVVHRAVCSAAGGCGSRRQPSAAARRPRPDRTAAASPRAAPSGPRSATASRGPTPRTARHRRRGPGPRPAGRGDRWPRSPAAPGRRPRPHGSGRPAPAAHPRPAPTPCCAP